MKTNISKIVIIGFILLNTFLISYGQQNDSLLQYLEIAAKNNPTVMQKYNEYQASLQKIPQVTSLPNPDISFGVFLSPMELVSGNQVADIQIMQMFPWFGVIKNSKDEMSLMAQANYTQFEDAKLQVFYDVYRTWNQLQKTNQQILVLKNNLEILKTLERLSIIKYKTSGGNSTSSTPSMSNNSVAPTSNSSSGMQTMGGGSSNNQNQQQMQPTSSKSMGGSSSGSSSLLDVYSIQIEIAELENSITSLTNQQKTNVAEFNTYLLRPLQTPIALPLMYNADSLPKSFTTLSDSVFKHNPMIEMLSLESQSLDSKKKMIQGMSYPMIGIGLNYSIITKSDMSTSSMNGKDMIMPMISVSLPIYQKKYTAMKSETDFLKSSKEQEILATSNSLQLEYYKAIQLYEDAQNKLKLYENQTAVTQKMLDISVKSFSASSVDLSEILRLRQQLLDYQNKKIEAIADINTSIALLKRIMSN